jgi:hypothetical protein
MTICALLKIIATAYQIIATEIKVKRMANDAHLIKGISGS